MLKMNSDDISTTFERGEHDGRKLYDAAAILKHIGFVLLVILCISCVFLALFMLVEKGFPAFMLSITISAILLLLLYAAVIVGTNTAQVLVHLLNSNLALLSIATDKLESVGAEKVSTTLANARNERIYLQESVGSEKVSTTLANARIEEKDVNFEDENFPIETLNDAKQYCQQSGYTLSSDGDKFILKANRLTHFFYSEKEVISWCIRDFEKTKPVPQQPSSPVG